MSLLIASQPNKPNRLDGLYYNNKDTDKEYHLDYAKWAITSSQTYQHSKWLQKIKINKEFYMNEQWTFEEDLETFLMDSTGQTVNRIQITNNVIRPMVEQYRGNAARLKINATAKSISRLAINRREKALADRLFRSDLLNEFPYLGQILQKREPDVSADPQETKEIFENLYVDMYVTQMNNLLRFSANYNRFEDKQVKLAQNLALTGLIVEEPFEHGGHLRWRIVESEDFFWDADARELDLSDAAYMGFVHPMDVATICERWQLKPKDAEAIENYASTSNDTTFYADTANTREYKVSRIPVYKVFWKDIMRKEYGYVLDEYGYPYLTQINYTHPGEDEPRYTDDDLIDPPDSPKNKRLFKGKKKRRICVDYIRSCTFVPGEVVGKANKNDGSEDGKDKQYDIVLEYGMEDYQETELLDIANVKFPLKCQTWGLVDGEIFTPVDDAIDPQRLINRILSATEQLINNSGGAGPIIDEDVIDPNSKEEIYRDWKEGRPITVSTRGKGIPNSVGYYDGTPKQGVYNMFTVIPILKQMIQDTTGVNEALRGESTGSDQLVGVTELLIQRGSLMQEPFYDAIAKLAVQKFQYTATVGKRMYIDNERELSVIVGDEGLEIFQMSKDLHNEDFRVFVTRENDDNVLRAQANQMLTIFMEQGLVSERTFSNLWDRSTPHEVSTALRNEAGKRAEAAKQAAAQQQQEEQALLQREEAMRQQDRQDKLGAQAQQERMADKQIASKENIAVLNAASKQAGGGI